MLTLKASCSVKGALQRGEPLKRSVEELSFFKSKMLKNAVAETVDGFDVWAGECLSPFQDKYIDESCIKNIRNDKSIDGILISYRTSDTSSSITVARTSGGTSPVYISSNDSNLCVSWKFEEAVANLDRPKPNVEVCRLFLKRGLAQTREQVIQGVYALWPGECAVFDGERLHFENCPGIKIVLPDAFTDQARATEAFIGAIAGVLEPVIAKADRSLLEFSGGMDSSCVAIAAASLGKPLDSYGVIQPGAVGRQQKSRREELINLLGLVDHTGSSISTLPFDSLSIDECSLTPNDDLYRMCLVDTLNKHMLDGVDIVITGLGGDDLCMENTFLRQKWEVPGHASASAMVASMGRADMLMRRGIWPVNPLAHPSVVDLCRAMPAAFRKGRLLNQFAMARAGLSDGYIFPRFHETFANVLRLESIERDFSEFFSFSLLNDLAIFDVSHLMLKASQKTAYGLPLRLVSKLWSAGKLESILRRYIA